MNNFHYHVTMLWCNKVILSTEKARRNTKETQMKSVSMIQMYGYNTKVCIKRRQKYRGLNSVARRRFYLPYDSHHQE